MSDEVLVEHADGVTEITINRPAARNAVNRAVSDGIAAALDEFESRKDLTVAIITGAGGTFCAGMDLKAFVSGEDVTHPARGFAGLTTRPPRKPIIAAVEGHALAGGCEIVLACDLVLAAEDARFGIPEVKRGLVAGAGGMLRLPQRIPYNLAMELALTGDPLPAADAHRYGLVNHLTEPGAALTGARSLAARIAANGPLAVQTTKELMTASRDWPTDEFFTRQQEALIRVFTSKDAREGATAFAEKRAPVWRGE
ncbi:crotonase/enoyl-CoA hydratase family protein [Yinghuangia seranimata]|uniref:crotonase/enoyl-CoA hydratase family protein n=1 Tax=Yinghuangia seranimata TaxID=408067 RepID=UPI00248B5998|nr:crotonase/enoyl-CoA hydratase family protein [Yinghuangia seranimata]MDI2129893.1 crotonase/enoyl-CoA hydratase family protein [Yinghuangia seranimata]